MAAITGVETPLPPYETRAPRDGGRKPPWASADLQVVSTTLATSAGAPSLMGGPQYPVPQET